MHTQLNSNIACREQTIGGDGCDSLCRIEGGWQCVSSSPYERVCCVDCVCMWALCKSVYEGLCDAFWVSVTNLQHCNLILGRFTRFRGCICSRRRRRAAAWHVA